MKQKKDNFLMFVILLVKHVMGLYTIIVYHANLKVEEIYKMINVNVKSKHLNFKIIRNVKI